MATRPSIYRRGCRRIDWHFFHLFYFERRIGRIIKVMGGFVGILMLIGIVVIPLTLVYFGGKYDWRFRRIPEKELQEKTRKDWEYFGRLLGFILILSVFGISFAPNTATFVEFPFWLRGIILLFGAVLIYASKR